MGEPDDPSILRSVKSKAAALGLGRSRDSHSILPSHHANTNGSSHTSTASEGTLNEKQSVANSARARDPPANRNNVADQTSSSPPPPAPPPGHTQADGDASSSLEPKPPMLTRMRNGCKRFINHTKRALLSSWINLLLVFVPIGIAVHLAHLSPEIVFAMNAVAIVPLAGLLAHATEAVAARLGDALGALLNVSFGNAVELILFIILLADDQIEVVQAALLGSILANLLLILGMAFLLGGLRYQEQVYNSTVTQMSAVMLSLAVMSLLLPTAFHAAFNNNTIADQETLYVSRGTSVVLLLVYVLYLLFQLKSHTYMYASTPQHIIDEESRPGVLADVLDSSSSDSSSDSSSSDSDSSAGSHNTTLKKMKRAFKKRRKSSASSKDTHSDPSVTTSPSVENHRSYFETQRNAHGHVATTENESAIDTGSAAPSRRASVNPVFSGDEADDDEQYAPVVRDFEAGSSTSLPNTRKEKRKQKHKKKHRKRAHKNEVAEKEAEAGLHPVSQEEHNSVRVSFAEEVQQSEALPASRRQFIRPALPSLLSNNVFMNPQNPAPPGATTNLRIAAPRSLHRSKSMPETVTRQSLQQVNSSRPTPPVQNAAAAGEALEQHEEGEVLMSRTAAVVMLLISTALVAVCADFLSESIEPMVEKTSVSEAFIGLIILPIVGNAAEHVTAVLVAMKNKMDLSIGIAVGSSIQIAIFITPFIVILGWIMGKEMTLYFNIFETVALFVTAFVVNFLVLDGRSNYLEGSLLIAAYVIIALASFFYPDGCEASAIGGNEDCQSMGDVAQNAQALVKRMIRM